jgi:hypothetical protein
MKNMDDNRPIYSDETETVVLRVKDFKQAIEAATQLPVSELLLLDKSKHPELLAEESEMPPKRAWFFEATFQTDEGEKEAEAIIGLKDGVLQLYNRVRPVLKIFKEKDRKRAKEGIPELTQDYIAQLERVGVNAWVLWKDLYEYVKDDPRLKGLKGPMRAFRAEYEKVGNLLPDYPKEEKD